jgi:hypothetical protein
VTHSSSSRLLAGALAAAALLLPGAALAQAAQGPWQFRASIYGYFPSVSGSSSFPTNPPGGGGGGSTIDLDNDKVIDSIDGFFMGALEAHNGRWGLFTDFMYLSLSASRGGSRDFTIGGGAIAADTSANFDMGLKGKIWTLAGEYRLASDPSMTLDLLGGARMFQLKPSLRWDISGSLGSLPPAQRSGSYEREDTNWDAIVGVKGRYAFGEGQRWLVPFYLDVGTGNSKLTWQASAGIGYAFSWGEISAHWRYLAYEMKAGQPSNDLQFNGPMVGATFKF